MALNASTLKNELKNDLIAIFKLCDEEKGITREEYADKIAASISSRLVQHITANAEVSTEVEGTTKVAGTAGEYPVKGSGKGKVS